VPSRDHPCRPLDTFVVFYLRPLTTRSMVPASGSGKMDE
jgi:hypothetical protein